jgi:SPP1 family phage portal protein
MIKVFEKEINETNVLYWMDLFKKGRQKELISLDAYYHGKDPIGKAATGTKRINNNVHVNLASMIVKNATDYFIGEPVAYSYSEGFKAQEYVDDLQFKNIEDAENKGIAIDTSKFGLGYELVNIKDDKTLFYKRLDPMNTFDVYTIGLVPERICCISYITYKPRNKAEITEGFIYSAEEIVAFTMQHRRVTFGKRTPNVFGKIPIVYYQNNADRKGDYERVTDLLTAYNKLMSCAVDDYESISNAILLIRDSKKIDEDTKGSLNSTRVIQLFSENAEMAFINKTLDSTFVKTLRESLREDILTITNVPDFTDDKFAGNSSGVSLQYKLIGFENLRADKEIYFKQALARRWEIISLYPAKSFELKRDDIKIDMYPNLPSNVELDNEIADLYNKGVISRKTMLEKLQMVKDANEKKNVLTKKKRSAWKR